MGPLAIQSLRLLPLLLILHLMAPKENPAQDTTSALPFHFSMFHNAPSLPFQGTGFTPPIHPGLEAGTSFTLGKGADHRWELQPALGYFYHRLAHHGIHLRGKARYTRFFSERTGLHVHGDLGYLHTIPHIAFYETGGSNGVQRALRGGRPQLLTGLGLGPDFRLAPDAGLTVFLDYRFWLQWPFVNQYVPLLPNTAVHLGVKFELNGS